MSVIVLPCRTDLPSYTFEIDLEGRTFGFSFRWNDRAAAWEFGVYLPGAYDDDHRLLAGRAVVPDLPLLARFRDPRLPAGEIVAVDTTGTGAPPGLDELGGRVKLLYFDLADIPAGWRS